LMKPRIIGRIDPVYKDNLPGHPTGNLLWTKRKT